MLWSIAVTICNLMAISTFFSGAIAWAQNTTAPRSATSNASYHILPEFDNPESAWDCRRPIYVAVNATQIPITARNSVLVDLNATLTEISARSPFTFVIVGPTTAIPTQEWAVDAAKSEESPDVVVFFGYANQTDLMHFSAAAVGGVYRITDLDGSGHLRSGFVVINLLQFADFKSGSSFLSRPGLFRHELLYVLGLDNNERSDSVMTSRVNDSCGRLGPGDLEGLAHQGRIGCGY